MRAWLPWLLILLALADWALLRSGRVSHPSWILAALVLGAIALLVLRLVTAARDVRSMERRRVTGIARLIALAGVVVVLGSGFANWSLRLDGFVILQEGERVPLHQGAHLQEFEAGPLASLDEMQLTLGLEKLELRPAASGFFYPESRLVVIRGENEARRLEVHPRMSAAMGDLRFFQGAFGFAPRIVILRAGEAVFDEVVPFTTERRQASGVSFAGEFTLASENLAVEGSVDLASLDEAMQGHATLHLAVRQGDDLLGRGSILPGHFADIERDYRIGFAGLERWSEIDISRRHQGTIMLAGMGLAVAGVAFWGVAFWRGW
jgi:hypothetical protein